MITIFFIRTREFWLCLSVLIVFSIFRLICSYFVLVTIIIFDLALHICICIIHAEYFWLVLAGLKEKFYTSILRFVYITFCLLMEPQAMLQLKILMGQTLFYCKVFSELVHSVHSLLVCVSSFNWFDLYLTLEVFLGPCIQPGHCS